MVDATGESPMMGSGELLARWHDGTDGRTGVGVTRGMRSKLVTPAVLDGEAELVALSVTYEVGHPW
jgi:hypothetical protein